jgi:hypothetical protein
MPTAEGVPPSCPSWPMKIRQPSSSVADLMGRVHGRMSPVRFVTAKVNARSAPPRPIPEDDDPFGLESFPYPRLKWRRALTLNEYPPVEWSSIWDPLQWQPLDTRRRSSTQDCPRFVHRWRLHQWHHGIGSSGPRWQSEEQRLCQRAFSLRSTYIRKRPNCMD